MNNLICVIILTLITSSLFGQDQYTIKGTVKDASGEALSYGDARLLNASDSSIVKFSYVEEGSYTLGPSIQGDYLLLISALGYEDVFQAVSLFKDTELNITLSNQTVDLNEVVVTDRKNLFENNNGDLKVNVANSILSAEPNPVSLLAKLPEVQVSPQGDGISVIGRGEALIYIGNRRLSSEELNNISVRDILNIEIIQNPSVKYEANGRAVILLTLKKKTAQGYVIELHQTVDYRENLNLYSGVNLSYKKNQFEFKGNADYNRLRPWESNSFNFQINDQAVETFYTGVSNTKRPQYRLGAGLFYKFNPNTYISYGANLRTINDTYTNLTESFFEENNIRNDILTNNLGDEEGYFFSNNFNLNLGFPKSQSNLFMGAQFSTLLNDEKNDISNEFDNSGISSALQNRRQDYMADAFSARIDYEKTFGQGTRLEVGAKVIEATANTDFTIKFVENIEDNSSTVYDYNEGNYAAYTQLSGAINRVNYTVGVRTETTDIQSKFKGDNADLIDTTYTNLFPRATISFPVDSTKTLSFNFSKSIQRPNFSNASQLNVYVNPFLVFQSNLNLFPSITTEASTTLRVQNKSITFRYSDSKNPVLLIPTYDENENLLSMVFRNVEHQKTYSLRVIYPFSYKSWRSTAVIGGYYSILEDSRAIEMESNPYLYVYFNNQFRLPKGYTASLSAWGMSRRQLGAFERNGLFVVNMGASKRFFNKLNCSIQFNDIFNTTEYADLFNFNGINSDGVFFVDSRALVVSLSYSFGKIKKSNFRNEDIDDDARF